MQQPTFTSKEVVAVTRISARQLQWWDEQGIVVPERQGHKRIYSRDDLAEIAIVCDLRARGFSLQKIRRVIRFLQKELGKRLVETVAAASEFHLLTDGRHIFLEDSARGRGRPAEKRSPADVNRVPERHNSAHPRSHRARPPAGEDARCRIQRAQRERARRIAGGR